MFPPPVIHDPDVLRDRSARISQTACRNSHIPHDPNAADPRIIGRSELYGRQPRRR
jgi:hypothetical protein